MILLTFDPAVAEDTSSPPLPADAAANSAADDAAAAETDARAARLTAKAEEMLEIGDPEGVRAAVKLLERAADLGSTDAMLDLGDLYSGGYAVDLDVDFQQAELYLRKALEAGDQRAKADLEYVVRQISLGTDIVMRSFHSLFDDDISNDEAALEDLRVAADAGKEGPTVKLAQIYRQGTSTMSPDFDAAFYWYSVGAQRGFPDAMHGLADLYSAGQGVPKDLEMSSEWMLKAAIAGDVFAEQIMARRFLNGTGVTADPRKAYGWARKADEHGGRSAKKLLGLMYAEGLGTRKNPEAAVSYYFEALGFGIDGTISDLVALAHQDRNFGKLVQLRLQQDGLYTGKIDGSLGPATISALTTACVPQRTFGDDYCRNE